LQGTRCTLGGQRQVPPGVRVQAAGAAPQKAFEARRFSGEAFWVPDLTRGSLQASSTVSLQATVDASSGSLLRPAFADATDEFGALILAQAPRTVDGVCAAAPAKQTGAAATSFAARVATTQRANAAAPGGCYLDC